MPTLNITVPPMSAEHALSTIDDAEDRYDEDDEDDEDQVDPTLKSLFQTHVLDPLVPAQQANEAPLPSIPVESLRPPRWVEDAEEDHGAMDASEQPPLTGTTVPCVLLAIQQVNAKQETNDIDYIYLSAEGATECYVPGQNDDELTSIANDEIAPGYVLIRTDEDDRQSLFDRVVQLADAQPTMKYLKLWRDYWLEAISSLVPSQSPGRARRGTYQQVRRRLSEAGVQVTEATIRGWVLGERIGPASIESVRGVAKLSGHPMLLQYPGQVDAAFKQIRTIHQVLGRRISAMLQALGKTVRQDATAPSSQTRRTQRDVHLDPALAVPIDDLIDLLEFFEVISVDVGPWEVPTSREGVILGAPLYGGK